MTVDTSEARHEHLEQRNKRKRRRRHRRPSIAALRVRDLNRLFTARYGEQLPNDDSGRDDVVIMVHHLASIGSGNPVDRVHQWIRLRAPWFPFGDLQELVRDALTYPRRWKADRLAWRLRLTEQDRAALRITTIGAIDLGRGSRLARRRRRKRETAEQRRRAAGSTPRHQYEDMSLSRAKPWTMLGISRATWYRLGKPAVPPETGPGA